MAIIKCKMCGGDMEISADKTFGICVYCGSVMTLPKISDEQRAAAFNRGNHFRRSGEFDKALSVYERIVAEDDTDAEAHWCCALCRFGIEYVEDPATYEYMPTCHRASFDSFLEDVDYLAAVEHSDGITRRQYQKDAAKIAEVQRGILATSQNEEPFDVFLCYKETDENGSRTKDSTLAQDIYYQLTEQGRRVFFARITLEDKGGAEYEPYIFAALNSAKVMIAVGTKPEHFNAVWVKNEWSRFLSLMKKDHSKLLLPCYRDMDPYDLPEALSVLQSYDMGKIGFIQDLIRGVNKVLDAAAPKAVVKETVVINNTANANTAPLLKRAFMYLEDGDWQSADEYCERVLDIDPENADAYLGKMMAAIKCHRRGQLRDQAQPFDKSGNYQKAVRFADEELKRELTGCITYIKERNELQRLTELYANASGQKEKATTESAYLTAAALFDRIQNYKDAKQQAAQCRELAKNLVYRNAEQMIAAETEDAYKTAAEYFDKVKDYRDATQRAQECREKAETIRKDALYNQACFAQKKDDVKSLEHASKLFSSISDWKDAEACATTCRERIVQIQTQEKERERRNDEERRAVVAAREKQEKRKKNIQRGVIAAICLLIVFVILMDNVIVPIAQYSIAQSNMNKENYADAAALFTKLGEYKDSEELAQYCNYENALDLLENEKYVDAMKLLQPLGEYKDAQELVLQYQWQGMYVGGSIYFGNYEQDGDENNGAEPIEWIVLLKNEETALVISKYVLEFLAFSSKTYINTWEECAIRLWLNETFLNKAFADEEEQKIVLIDNGTDVAGDKLFLLNSGEAEGYFKNDEDRKAYATIRLQQEYPQHTLDGLSMWWLRSPGQMADSAVTVNSNGKIYKTGVNVVIYYPGVRPAMWVSLEALEE